MRHAQRPDKEFRAHTTLTDEGYLQAQYSVPNQLINIPFDAIYSSNYIRCIETIYYYVLANGHLINLDNALAERSDSCLIPSHLMNVINTYYVPKYEELPNNFTFDGLKSRVSTFLYNIPDNSVILCVTHNPVINAIMNILGHAGFTYRNPTSPVATLIGPIYY
jgi:broad specificity phosphatase PhoE